MKTRITELLGTQYPVLQGGMAWISDGKLAAAVSNGGGLGIITTVHATGADYVREQIAIARSLTDKPFGVNVVIMTPWAAEVAEIVVEEGVPVVTTGAGNPRPFMPRWLDAGIKVIPVIASAAMAEKV
ncbi:MAG: nitronate monooxygenase, partial [Oscillospiraceae bacterium]|nr:nitronate monooxygenase [Oscillospiraceae bacterium]